jgi:uncharacterized protein (UPF0332 family)
MSPRSEEFMASARERLKAARNAISGGTPSAAVSDAYYAGLYAARAALSERDLYAKTHRGTWNLVRQTLVADGSLPAELVSEAGRLAQLREAADYDAAVVEREQAERAIDAAERFLRALDELLD